jgi:hypothetical protein
MGVDTIGGAIANIFWFLGEVAFTWVPATVGTLTGTAPESTPPLTFINQPVTTSQVVSYLQQSSPAQYAGLYVHWAELVAVAVVLSVLFGALIVYSALRLMEVRRHERARFQAAAHPVAAHDISRTQLHWDHVMEEANSDDDSRWRLAILEADIMLNELLDVLGYRGETMADKMKQVDRANFRTIDLAWEAHRIRNQVAHQGTAHLLSPRETRRVMGLYEEIFREFKLIA